MRVALTIGLQKQTEATSGSVLRGCCPRGTVPPFRRTEGAENSSSRVSVARCDHGLDIAADAEVAHNRHFPRIEQVHQIIENSVGNVLVKNSLIPKLVQIELQAFQLHAPIFGNVLDLDRGEVGKAGSRANASELGAGEIHGVATHGGPVRKPHQTRFANHLSPVGS